MRRFFANMTIRTSLLGLVAFFAFMLVIGALLGVLSLRISNGTLMQFKQVQDVGNALSRVVGNYKDVLSGLGRAGVSLYADMQPGTERHRSEETSRLLLNVGQLLGKAKTEFNNFKTLPHPAGAAGLLQEVDTAFVVLVRDGLEPLLRSLEQGDVAAYQEAHLHGSEYALEARFNAAVDAFDAWRTDMFDSSFNVAEVRYTFVLYAVGAGGIMTVFLCIGAYVFLRKRIMQPLQDVGAHFGSIAGGDLTLPVDVGSSNEVGQLFAALQRMQDSLTTTVAAVRRGVDEINIGSHEIAAGNAALSRRTEQQAASLQETAASMEELASTVKQNADSAHQANQLSVSASAVAQRGGAVVSDVVSTMQGIAASSNKISEIVSVIDGIAFQTNILALNAAVEAARAGHQGKGFAVVAGEVRSLAQRSAQAAQEVKNLIEESVNRVAAGSTQVELAGTTMSEIVASVLRVTDIMSEISSASDKQASGIEQVNRAVSQMDEVTQQNAALVEQAAASAMALQDQAESLAQAVSVFKIQANEVIEVPAFRAAGLHRQAQADGSLPSARLVLKH